MKYSELLTALLEQPIELDGKTDYRKVADILLNEFNIKPRNEVVWKIINDIRSSQEDYVELTFD